MKTKARAVSLDSLEIDLQQYWLILKRRWFPTISVFSFVLMLSMLFASLQKPVYRAQGKLLLKVDRIASLTGVGTGLEEFSPLTLQSSPMKTESEVLLSTPLLEQVITQLQLKEQNGNLLKPEALQGRLEVKQIPGADVLQLSFNESNPQTAAAVVNQLMQAYINNNILTSRKQAAAARRVIAEQLPRSENTVQRANRELRNFKERNGITNLEEESKALVASAAQLENEITKAQTQLADANSRLASLQDKVGLSSDAAIAVSSLSQSLGVQQALKEFQEVQSQLAVARSVYQEQSPIIVNLKEKEAALQAILQGRTSEILGRSNVSNRKLQIGTIEQELIQKFVNTEVERLGLTSQVKVLSNTRELYQRRSRLLPKLEQGQRDLQQRLDAAQSSYETLLKKFQEVQVVEQQNMGNASIVEMASVPESPEAKKKTLTQLLGGLLATLAALITMMVLEISDRSVKSIKEARQLFNHPWLGSIPHFGKYTIPHSKNACWSTPTLPVRDFPRSPVSSAYRLLQANLKFLDVEKELKTLVVTSSVPKEGKSTISANLAATIAQLGRRVLLIDTDLHHPQQHHIWNLTNAVGLTNVIVKQINFADAVNKVMENLDVLTSGVIPPNPLAILDSKPMKALVASAAQQYDFVILDGSPLIVEAEALTLGKMTDGILLVVRPGVLDFGSANTAKELLQQSAQTILGIVVNCAASETEYNRFTYYKQDEPDLLNSATSPGLNHKD
ncbi:lipopolysaccharide biosynthesis protein [Nostoc sp. 'Peltigera membranacea cyanobiont' 210A]|uniref:GumC family protein n=1 Tax=Nostoc sp. 'Peltigera membranacea cyanobiont' 210A TaxID=2014529 RepID=UPI000B95363C|nr:polysaccharide biosynthesis tyrosine autokinase [Nostoc sp. 'Peltigera membranacea cyanobiont' 210A]OYD90250.1 lipopolysaccharide biosynthesis protein [Nostoc sp. 'Peltigera membranacea cyanobiont' 210A]